MKLYHAGRQRLPDGAIDTPAEAGDKLIRDENVPAVQAPPKNPNERGLDAILFTLGDLTTLSTTPSGATFRVDDPGINSVNSAAL
jgi:hypothetical protein